MLSTGPHAARLGLRHRVVLPLDNFSIAHEKHPSHMEGVLAVFAREVIDALVDDEVAHCDGAQYFEMRLLARSEVLLGALGRSEERRVGKECRL